MSPASLAVVTTLSQSSDPVPAVCVRTARRPHHKTPPQGSKFFKILYFSLNTDITKKKIKRKKRKKLQKDPTIKHSGLIETEKNKAACICALACLLAHGVHRVLSMSNSTGTSGGKRRRPLVGQTGQLLKQRLTGLYTLYDTLYSCTPSPNRCPTLIPPPQKTPRFKSEISL